MFKYEIKITKNTQYRKKENNNFQFENLLTRYHTEHFKYIVKCKWQGSH